MINFSDIEQRLQAGKAGETADLVAKALEENYSVEDILAQALIPGIRGFVEKHKRGEIFQPELLAARRAMNWGIETLRFAIADRGGKPRGVVVTGVMKGDIQDFEKDLMIVALENKALRVIDLGTGIDPERLVETAIVEKARFILCAANLPSAMGQLKLVVHAALTSGIRNFVTIMVSGAPVSERYCQAIGADCYVRDALGAAKAAEAVLTQT
jgi:methanogenic corrinoid protein MtbC1